MKKKKKKKKKKREESRKLLWSTQEKQKQRVHKTFQKSNVCGRESSLLSLYVETYCFSFNASVTRKAFWWCNDFIAPHFHGLGNDETLSSRKKKTYTWWANMSDFTCDNCLEAYALPIQQEIRISELPLWGYLALNSQETSSIALS